MALEQVSGVRSRLETSKSGNVRLQYFVDCRCSYCGKVVEKRSHHAKRDESCGCQQSRLLSKSISKHGMYQTSTYAIWTAMIQRTTNKNYKKFKNYGGRGIYVCDRWLNSFEAFFEDMGERPGDKSLDRIDNSKGYEPGNCRWADATTQGRNRRTNRMLTIDGVARCVAEWAEQPGAASRGTIGSRLWHGWSDREAVFGKSK